jgi:hypothetical protein
MSRAWLIPALACVAAANPFLAARANGPGSEMAEAAQTFLAALDDSQRAKAVIPFTDPERANWNFVPMARRGLTWKEMAPAQRHLATALLASGLSQRGLVKAQTIMSLEQILLELEQGKGPVRDPELYYWAIFGSPGSTNPWGWRVEGHHFSANFTVVGDHQVSATPWFLGSNPAEVRQGPRKGLRALAREEDLGRELLRSLDPAQRTVAVIADEAYPDVLTGNQRKVSPLEPAGLAASKMSESQTKTLRRLIEEYVRRARPEVADLDLARIEKAGFGNIHFAWAGADAPGKGSYYRVQGPSFLLEYDCTQNNANHIHAVWRDFNGDFGEDILARHYRETPHAR